MSDQLEFPKIEYCIFDMDGLLTAETLVPTDDILGRYGYKYTWEIKSGVMGKVQREAVQYIYDHCPGLSEKLSIDDFLEERNRKQDELFAKVQPMEGAVEIIKHLHKHGIPIALATGSHDLAFKVKTVSNLCAAGLKMHVKLTVVLIDTFVCGPVRRQSHLPHLFDAFPADSILTADSKDVPKGREKPHPDIYLAAARSLGRNVGHAEQAASDEERIERSKGLVFEDAIPGARAGVRAGMNVIWVPDPSLRALNPKETHGAKVIVESLREFRPEQWGLPSME
ncbi:hypothetical protein QFC19_002283 [Naganishia cerealis]|uniref:Uncharacterized protein n=1 Tax=Naganishia cerealis TaxID=610337 RepID=A0ACC2WBY0_9TREE|nr:hypothetical protein QFC19_002283 [Naganishia cerealis]